MEKIRIVVNGSTGSAYKNGELLPSGIIKYDDGQISHISGEISHGRSITEYIEPVVIKVPEILAPSPIRSLAAKAKKKKA